MINHTTHLLVDELALGHGLEFLTATVCYVFESVDLYI